MQYLLKDFTISRSRVKYGRFLTDDTENITFLDHYLQASLFYITYYYMFLWISYLIDLNFNWLNLFKRLLKLYIKGFWGRKMKFSLAGRLRASGEELWGWRAGVLPWRDYGMLSSLLERKRGVSPFFQN